MGADPNCIPKEGVLVWLNAILVSFLWPSISHVLSGRAEIEHRHSSSASGVPGSDQKWKNAVLRMIYSATRYKLGQLAPTAPFYCTKYVSRNYRFQIREPRGHFLSTLNCPKSISTNHERTVYHHLRPCMHPRRSACLQITLSAAFRPPSGPSSSTQPESCPD